MAIISESQCQPRCGASTCTVAVGALVVGTIVFAVASVCALRSKWRLDAERRIVQEGLEELASRVGRGRLVERPPVCVGVAEKGTGWETLTNAANLEWAWSNLKGEDQARVLAEWGGRHSGTPRDVWDHPIYYRCPGPVHKDGFDFISCGPNGIYEEGQGDDIVVGEDL